MFGGKQREKEIFDKIATDFNAKSSTVVTGEICSKMEQPFPIEKFPEIHTEISGLSF